MKKILTASLLSLAFGTAFAASAAPKAGADQAVDTQGVTVSTDPAKAAEVERRAAELKAADDKTGTSGTSAKADTKPSRHHHHRAKHHAKKSAKSGSATTDATTGK